ncbi:MAG: YbaY family lipoprotein [Chloroflexi bacterium]|nr:YbaY family lipoprotein [Chloroflexota bacterium]
MNARSTDAEPVLVTGDVVLPPGSPAFRDATLHVQLRDTSRADARSAVVANEVRNGISHTSGCTRLPFALRVPTGLDSRATYLLHVHVDLNGSGKIESGDFITMASHRVPLDRRQVRVDVDVGRVG